MPSTTMVDGVEFTWLGHASVRAVGSVTVYIDPWGEVMTGDESAADLVLVTHPHFDHYDADAIDALAQDDTFVVLRGVDAADAGGWDHEFVEPGHHDAHHGVEVRAVPAYNDHRFREADVPYHPADESCGYVFTLDGTTVYHAGDTDHIDEMADLPDIDVAFLPIGGTYTMDAEEAADAVATIAPDIVVPIHYGHVDGTAADPQAFRETVEKRTDTEVSVLQPTVR